MAASNRSALNLLDAIADTGVSVGCAAPGPGRWSTERAQVCLGEIPLRMKIRKAHSTDATELGTHLPNANAANRALALLGRELNLFTEKKEVGKPGDFDQ